MKILSVHVENFGRLHHYDRQFNDTLNVILENNGWGKTTLSAFIRAMFYGLEENRRNEIDNERKHYAPWQGGAFGGSCVFESGGRTYQIRRIFKDKPSNDTFELEDVASGRVVKDLGISLGEKLFQMNRDSFKKTVSMGQEDLVTGATDDIHARISRMEENDRNLGSCEDAVDRITGEMNKLNPNRATGTLFKLNGEVHRLETEVRNGAGAEDRIHELDKRIQGILDKEKQLDTELLEAEKLEKQTAIELKTSAEKENWEQLTERKKQREDSLRKTAGRFPEGIPDEKTIRRTQEALSEAARLKERLRLLEETPEEKQNLLRLQNLFQEETVTEEEASKAAAWLQQERLSEAGLSNRLQVLKEQEKQDQDSYKQEQENRQGESEKFRKKARDQKADLILGLVLLIGGGALAFFYTGTSLVFWGSLGLSALGALLSVIFGISVYKTGKKATALQEDQPWHSEASEGIKTIQDRQEHLEKDMNVERTLLETFCKEKQEEFREDQIQAIIEKVREERDTLSKLLARQEERKKEREEIREKLGHLEPETRGFFKTYGLPGADENQEALLEVAKMRDRYLSEKKLFEEAKAELGRFEDTHDKVALMMAKDKEALPELSDLQDRIGKLREEKDKALTLRHQYEKQLETQNELYDRWLSNKDELEEKREELTKGMRAYALLEKTRDLLTEAKEEVTRAYTAPMLKSFRYYYSLLTGEAGQEYDLDASAALTMEKSGLKRNPRLLSQGYQDLTGLCLRLALADAMFPKEKPMLILDDPFINLDTEKTKRARNFLEKAAERYQILYFTCHQGRS